MTVANKVPVLANILEQSDKTDTTGEISNVDFLKTLYGDLGESRGWVASLKGNIKTGNWTGSAWDPTTFHLPSEANNYFCLSSFRRNADGIYVRKEANFGALHALMLDDVGTKVALDRLELPPSWLLETSQGNFQAGYLLAEPLEDAPLAKQLMKAIIDAGLCDRGAGAPATRYARLPIGVNSKRQPVFACRLHSFTPTHRYSVEEIVKGFQLDLDEAPRSKKRHQPRQVHDDEKVLIPSPVDNPVVAKLKCMGLYKKSNNQIHDITCPWHLEHTDQIDSGAAYFEPTEQFPLGGFHCFHGHCEHRRIGDLLAFLEIERDLARMKPILRLQVGEIPRITDAAEALLAKTQRYYQRGGLIVQVAFEPTYKEHSIKPMNIASLTSALANTMLWTKFDKRSGEWGRSDPPARNVEILFNSQQYRHLPVLAHLARQPYLRPDGSLNVNSGYDAAMETYGIFNQKEFSVPEEPSKEDAKVALAKLLEILSEFSFANATDRATALSAMLTAAIRPSLPSAPMFHVKAAQKGSGKSYLNKIIQLFASPQPDAPLAFPKDEEECQKTLLARLLTCPAVIEFDNLTTDLVAYNSLCTALTSGHLTGRILGISKTATVGTRALFLSSGNNVGPVADMARRCLTIGLDPVCEVPAMRTFQNPNLANDILDNRAQYVSAALTIVRAWIIAGRPRISDKRLAGFDLWSDLCREPLLWLEEADPIETAFQAMSEDPERTQLGRLLKLWFTLFKTKPMMVREVLNFEPSPADDFEGASEDLAELKELFHDIAGERGGLINNRRLGHWLKRQNGVNVDGLRFLKAAGNRSAEAWYIQKVS